MDAEAHDQAVAGISHLPLLLSAALVEAVAGAQLGPRTARAGPTASRLAAGGWRDMTRLARGDPAMGAGIAATNAPPWPAGCATSGPCSTRWQAELDAPGGPDAAAIEATAAGGPGPSRAP